MSCLKIYQDSCADVTIVSNRFIDEFMPQANDAQLKIYLFLLRMLSAGRSLDIPEIADVFNHTEKDVMRALKYWEKCGVLLLEYDGQAKLAAYHTKLLQTPWKGPDSLSLAIEGLTMDAVWENVIVQIGGIHLQAGNTLDQQISQDEQKAKLEKEIERLQKLLWAEKQPKKKFELLQRIKTMEKKL